MSSETFQTTNIEYLFIYPCIFICVHINLDNIVNSPAPVQQATPNPIAQLVPQVVPQYEPQMLMQTPSTTTVTTFSQLPPSVTNAATQAPSYGKVSISIIVYKNNNILFLFLVVSSAKPTSSIQFNASVASLVQSPINALAPGVSNYSVAYNEVIQNTPSICNTQSFTVKTNSQGAAMNTVSVVTSVESANRNIATTASSTPIVTTTQATTTYVSPISFTTQPPTLAAITNSAYSAKSEIVSTNIPKLNSISFNLVATINQLTNTQVKTQPSSSIRTTTCSSTRVPQYPSESIFIQNISKPNVVRQNALGQSISNSNAAIVDSSILNASKSVNIAGTTYIANQILSATSAPQGNSAQQTLDYPGDPDVSHVSKK